MKLWYFILRAIAYIPVRLLYPVKVYNKKLFPKRKKIILMSNHLTWRDVLLIAVYFPGFRHFLGKKELGKNPIVRLIAKSIGVIFIERGKSDLSSMRAVINVLKKGNSLTIFPEGTRNRVDTNIQEIKSGTVMFSVRGDAPLVPIYIDRPAKIFRRTNICVGETFELVDSENKALNSAIVKEKANVISQKMIEVKDEMLKIQEQIDLRKKKKGKRANESDIELNSHEQACNNQIGEDQN